MTHAHFFLYLFGKREWGQQLLPEVLVCYKTDVKVTRFGDLVEARTVHCSSFQCLVDSHKSLFSKGADTLIEEVRVGVATKEKFRKVVAWVRRAEPTINYVGSQSFKKKKLPLINWAVNEETQSQHSISLSDVLLMTAACKTTFSASVGEIFLPITSKILNESEAERRFIKRRLCTIGDSYLVEDLICSGCQHCGAPLGSELGFNIAQGTNPLYCLKSCKHIHTISLIYRPFLLYVWDDLEYIPLLVTNKQAELLFGNIRAESVYTSFTREKHAQVLEHSEVQEQNHSAAKAINRNDAKKQTTNFHWSGEAKSPFKQQQYHGEQTRKIYLIWLILLRTMLQQTDSPLRFQIRVDPTKDLEGGRFEMVSMSIPTPF